MEDCGLIMWISSLWFWSGGEPDRRQKNCKRVMTILFFYTLSVHCCSLLNISMSLLSTKLSRLSENEPVYPTFLLIQRSIFTIFPSVGAAMGFWERDMHISERSWQSTNTFIPALDDNSHQTLPLGTQIIPLLFRWSPRWYNCSKNTV